MPHTYTHATCQSSSQRRSAALTQATLPAGRSVSSSASSKNLRAPLPQATSVSSRFDFLSRASVSNVSGPCCEEKSGDRSRTGCPVAGSIQVQRQAVVSGYLWDECVHIACEGLSDNWCTARLGDLGWVEGWRGLALSRGAAGASRRLEPSYWRAMGRRYQCKT